MKTCLDPLTALPAGPDRLVDLAAEHGFDYVSFRMYRSVPEEADFDLIEHPDMIRALRKRIEHHGLSVLGTETVRLDGERGPMFWDSLMAASQDIGAETVMVQIVDTDRVRAIDEFGSLCALADRFDLRLDLEFIPWTALASLKDALEVLNAVNSDRAGLLIDFLHFARSQSDIEDLSAQPSDRLRWVQVCDGPAKGPDTRDGLIHAGRKERDLPGAGGLDLGALYGALPRDAIYAVEIPSETAWNTIGVDAYVANVKRSLDASLAAAQFRRS